MSASESDSSDEELRTQRRRLAAADLDDSLDNAHEPHVDAAHVRVKDEPEDRSERESQTKASIMQALLQQGHPADDCNVLFEYVQVRIKMKISVARIVEEVDRDHITLNEALKIKLVDFLQQHERKGMLASSSSDLRENATERNRSRSRQRQHDIHVNFRRPSNGQQTPTCQRQQHSRQEFNDLCNALQSILRHGSPTVKIESDGFAPLVSVIHSLRLRFDNMQESDVEKVVAESTRQAGEMRFMIARDEQGLKWIKACASRSVLGASYLSHELGDLPSDRAYRVSKKLTKLLRYKSHHLHFDRQGYASVKDVIRLARDGFSEDEVRRVVEQSYKHGRPRFRLLQGRVGELLIRRE